MSVVLNDPLTRASASYLMALLNGKTNIIYCFLWTTKNPKDGSGCRVHGLLIVYFDVCTRGII